MSFLKYVPPWLTISIFCVITQCYWPNLRRHVNSQAHQKFLPMLDFLEKDLLRRAQRNASYQQLGNTLCLGLIKSTQSCP